MRIYDYETEEILKATTNMTEKDVRRHIERGVTIYSPEDFIDNLKDNGLLDELLEDMSITEEDFLQKLNKAEYAEDGIETGIYKGLLFVAEYSL